MPSDWNNIIKLARRKDPYDIIQMQYSEFNDYKTILSEYIPSSLSKDEKGVPVKWSQLKVVKAVKNEECLYIKTSFDEEFRKVKLAKRSKSVTHSQRRKTKKKVTTKLPVQRLYKKQLPISQDKKKDLLILCKNHIIPEIYHTYYQSS